MIVFYPRAPYYELLMRARRDIDSWLEMRDGRNPSNLADVTNDESDMMRRSRVATIQQLNNPLDNVRLVAVSLVADYWPANECFAADIVRMAFEDSLDAIRGAALIGLKQHRAFITDPSGVLQRLCVDLLPDPPKATLDRALDELRERESRMEKKMRDSWERVAGTRVKEMWRSRSTAEHYLRDPQPDIRCVALQILERRWMSKKELASVCERIIAVDNAPQVRSLGVVLLVGCHMRSDDRRIGRLVARLILDDSNPDDLRRHAYWALFSLRGLPGESFLSAISSDFHFPNDVDWSFVESFVQDGQ